MRKVIIEQVRLDPNRRVRLRPASPRRLGPYYVYIYRDASGVAWDELCGEFYVREIAESNPVDEFKRIVAAVAREYGEKLTLSSSTLYIDIPSEMVTAMLESAA